LLTPDSFFEEGTMTGPAVTMREIHRLRRFARDLQEQLERAPRQRKAQQAKVARQEEALREGQEAIKHLKVAIHEKEVTLKTTHGQIGKYQKQLNEATAKKEYDALQVEIANAKALCQRLEDEILTALAESEERTARLPELEKAVAQARAEFTSFEQGAQARLDDLQAQLRKTQERLKLIETEVPENVRVQYNRIVGAHGPDALAVVQGRTCSCCYTEITAQNYNDLQQCAFVVCKACGHILYLPEEA
jgi:predicted  nucleic acid-binding Zn-ribbon protein